MGLSGMLGGWAHQSGWTEGQGAPGQVLVLSTSYDDVNQAVRHMPCTGLA